MTKKEQAVQLLEELIEDIRLNDYDKNLLLRTLYHVVRLLS